MEWKQCNFIDEMEFKTAVTNTADILYHPQWVQPVSRSIYFAEALLDLAVKSHRNVFEFQRYRDEHPVAYLRWL